MKKILGKNLKVGDRVVLFRNGGEGTFTVEYTNFSFFFSKEKGVKKERVGAVTDIKEDGEGWFISSDEEVNLLEEGDEAIEMTLNLNDILGK